MNASFVKKLILVTIFTLGFVNIQANERDAYKNKNNVTSDKNILVIDSYIANSPWSRRIMDEVLSDNYFVNNSINIHIEYIQSLNLKTEQILDEYNQKIESIISEKKPILIICLDSPAFVYFENIFCKFNTIPIVLFSMTDYVVPVEYHYTNSAAPDSLRTPLSELTKKYNITTVFSSPFFEENIKLIKNIQPSTKTVHFISDKRQVSSEYKETLKKIITNDYPELTLNLITEGKYNTEELLLFLKNLDIKNDAVIYHSFYNENQISRENISIDTDKLISSLVNFPIYTLQEIGIDKNNFLGGATVLRNIRHEKTLNVIRTAIEHSDAHKEVIVDKNDIGYELNYPLLVKYDLLDNLTLPKVEYINKAPTFFEKYTELIIAFIILFIMTLIYLYYIYCSKEKEIKLLNQQKSLLNNMPVLYVEIEFFKDSNDNIFSYQPIVSNKTLLDEYIDIKILLGKMYKKGDNKDSSQNILDIIKTVSHSCHEFTFQYQDSETNKGYNITIRPSFKVNHIDLFMVDITELIITQNKLDINNSKMLMAINVAEIITCHWDVKSDTIVFDMPNTKYSSTGEFEDNINTFKINKDAYYSLIHPEDRKRVIDSFKKLIKGEKTMMTEEFRVLINNKYEWVEKKACIESYHKNGGVKSVISTSIVISERKRIEEELTIAKEKAEESNRLKSKFVANMSHEIRTPLNAIVGFSNILIETEDQEERKQYIQIIENNNDLLLQLIGDILDLSKIEAQTLEFNMTAVNLSDMLDEIYRSTMLKINNKDIELKLVKDLKNYNLLTERNRITQVITNFLTNSLKFTTNGFIEFGCKICDSDQNKVYFYVKDSGIGIAKDNHQGIFNRFIKINSHAQGTGLGLSICKAIIERMGGSIGVDSVEGVGSTFYFTIPYTPIKYSKSLDKPIEPKVKQLLTNKKIKILIAEDNESNFLLFKSILKHEYEIVHAWNGKEAVNLFIKEHPDLILMDINMPIMNGEEATSKIREISTTVPIIAVTAYAYASDKERLLKNGFDDFSPKPIMASRLKNIIVELLNQRFIML